MQDGVQLLAQTQFSNIRNNCASVLNASIDGVQNSLVLVAGGGNLFPAAPFYVSCEFEVMYCTGKSVDTLTVTRGADGTTAAAHTAGAIVEQRNNAALWTDISSAVNKIENGTTQVPYNPPNGSITNIMLAPDVPRPSVLQNGGFEQWHRGNGPFNTAALSTDDWFVSPAGTDTLSVSRDSANADGAGYCAVCTFVLGNGAGASQFVASSQAGVNSFDINSVIGKTVTFTARVKCSVANAVRLGINNYIAGSSYTYSSYHTGNGQYQTLTVTTTIATNATIVQFSVVFAASCTAYVDNASAIFGTVSSLYYPAQIPDVISNERLAADVTRFNILTNGGFEIWQRGNGPFQTNGAYTCDRWRCDIVGTVTSFDIHKITSTISQGTSAYVAANLSGTSPRFLFHQQALTADNIIQFQNKTLTFSAKFKSNTINSIGLYYQLNAASLGAPGYVQIFSATNTVANQAITQSISIVVPYDATIVQVGFHLSNISSVCEVDDATLVVGSVPADYVPLHPAEDLIRCQRYYEVATASNNQILFSAQAYNTTQAQFIHIYKVNKQSTPTITFTAPSGFICFMANGQATPAATSMVSNASLIDRLGGVITVPSGIVGGNSAQVLAASGQIASVFVECNP